MLGAIRPPGVRMPHRQRSISRRIRRFACALAAAPCLAQTWELQGTQTITAHTRDLRRITLGTVRFEPTGAGSASFVVTMAPTPLTDHFLSMKEFKCLEGPGELAWLEHKLLFLCKLPGDFGAKLWNGVYFQLRPSGKGLVGTPQAIDLNLVGAPSRSPDG